MAEKSGSAVLDHSGERVPAFTVPAAASIFILMFELIRGTSDSMGLSEAYSTRIAQLPFSSLFRIMWSVDANMGPYYIGLWFWVRIDDGDLWIRAFSTLGTIAAVWGIWIVSRRWSSVRVASVVVVVFALTPYALSWTMQARGYGWAMACMAWSLVFADRVLERGTLRSSVALGFIVGLGVAIQLSTAFVYAGIVVAMIATHPTCRLLRSLLIAGAVALVTFSPFAWAVISNPDQAEWIPALSFDRFVNQMTTLGSGPLWIVIVALGILLLVRALSCAQVPRVYWIPLIGSLTGVVGLLLVSLLARPMFVDRYLIGCIPLLVIAAVPGWSTLPSRTWSVVAAGLVAISAFNLVIMFDRTRPLPEDYRAATEMIVDSIESGDAIVAVPRYAIDGLTHYLPEGIETQVIAPNGAGSESFMILTDQGEVSPTGRVWVLIRGRFTDPTLRDWLNSAFPIVVEEKEFGWIRLQLRESRAD